MEDHVHLKTQLNKDKLLDVLTKSHSPYSKFRVSAQIVEKLSGESFFGCNVENASFGATICAERSAISSMVSNVGSKAEIKEVHIVSDMEEPVSPCGVCRQSLVEFSTSETRVYVYAKDMKSFNVFSMSDLLPHAFVSF